MQSLKYVSTAVVFQEVPNEVSLVFNISGCPHRCEGCHSKYLWEYKGKDLLSTMSEEIDKYKEYITCVCFMGGDQNMNELTEATRVVKNKYHLKTCVYSGRDVIFGFAGNEIEGYLDYLKLGSYKLDKGGLEDPRTNQRFFQLENTQAGVVYHDVTNRFRKKKD